MSATPPAPESAGKKSKLKPLLLVGAVLIVGVGGFAGGALVGNPLGGGHVPAAAPETAPVQEAVYYQMKEPLTANLADSGRYVQVNLAFSTRSGPAFVEALEKHDAALRSALIVALGALTEDEVASADAKEKLRARLRVVVNRALEQQGADGRVDQAFFAGFLVQ